MRWWTWPDRSKRKSAGEDESPLTTGAILRRHLSELGRVGAHVRRVVELHMIADVVAVHTDLQMVPLGELEFTGDISVEILQ